MCTKNIEELTLAEHIYHTLSIENSTEIQAHWVGPEVRRAVHKLQGPAVDDHKERSDGETRRPGAVAKWVGETPVVRMRNPRGAPERQLSFYRGRHQQLAGVRPPGVQVFQNNYRNSFEQANLDRTYRRQVRQ